MESDKLTDRDYADAVNAQSACNLSGIVHSLSKVMAKIWNEARLNGQGTDYVNKHPICRLYAEQILYLSGGFASSGDETYGRAYAECRDKAGSVAMI